MNALGISILEKFFPAKAAITSDGIAREIERANAEIEAQREKLASALAGVSTMTDEQHQAALVKAATIERAITRLVARAADLGAELPGIRANEEKAARVAADRALRDRAEACRKESEKGAAKLLAEYDVAAAKIGDILADLKAMDAKREAVNTALRSNPVAEPVASYTDIHRTTPGTQATEHRALRKCWVYRYPGSPADTGTTKFQYEAPREDVRPATIGPDGKAVPVGTEIHNYYGRELVITPRLEEREIIVARSPARSPRYEHPLADVRLPPAFAGEEWAWPRQ